MRQVRISGKKLLWGNKDHLREALASILSQTMGSSIARIKDDPKRLLQLFDIELSLVPNLDNRDVLIFDCVTLMAMTPTQLQIRGPGGLMWALNRQSIIIATMREIGEIGYILIDYNGFESNDPNYPIPPPIRIQVEQIEQGLKPHVSTDPSTWSTGAFIRPVDPLQPWTPFTTKLEKENPEVAKSLDKMTGGTTKEVNSNLGPPVETFVVSDYDSAKRVLQEGYPLNTETPIKITTTAAWHMRMERGRALPTDSEYENPRVLEIAKREKQLFDELYQLDTELKELCQDLIPPK